MAKFKVRYWDYSSPNSELTEVVLEADSFSMDAATVTFYQYAKAGSYSWGHMFAAYTNVISVRQVETDG